MSCWVFRDLLASRPEVQCQTAEDPRNVVVTSSIVSQNLTQGTDQGAWVQVSQEAYMQSQQYYNILMIIL